MTAATQPGTPQRPSLGKQLLRLSALAAVLASLPGCQSIEATTNNVATIRVVNASPDAGGAAGLDFYLNNTILRYIVGFGSTPLNYVPVVPGNYTISADQGHTTQTLVSAYQTLANGQSYTAVAGNVLANLQLTVLTDQTTPAPSGEVAFRFFDQATKVGAVDIYLVPTGGKLITTLPFLTGLTFGTNTGYIAIPANTYSIAIVPTGTVPIATTLTLVTTNQVTYTAGNVQTLILEDNLVTTTPAMNVISLTDYPQS